MAHRTLIVYAVLLLSSVASATFACLLNFATVAADDEAKQRQLASETYLQLLTQLGGGLSPETLAAVAKAENPFDIPDQENTDLATLQKTMKQLEAMLKEKGWRTPELSQRLRSDLAQYVRDRSASRVEAEHRVERSWQNYDIPIAEGRAEQITPDGRYLINSVIDRFQGSRSVNLYDLQNKTWIRTPIPGTDTVYHPAISPDGREFLFKFDSKYTVVPVASGKLDWTKAKDLEAVPKLLGAKRMFMELDSGGPRMVDLDLHGTVSIKTFARLKDGMRTLQLRPVGINGEVHLLYQRDAKSVFDERLAVAPDGEVTLLESRGPWKADGPNPVPNAVVWTDDGKNMVAYTRQKLSVSTFAPGDPVPTYLYSEDTHGPNYGRVENIAVNQLTAEAAILFHAQPFSKMKNWAEIVDMKNKKVKGRVELPWHTKKVLFNPEAKALLAIQENAIRVINYGQYLTE